MKTSYEIALVLAVVIAAAAVFGLRAGNARNFDGNPQILTSMNDAELKKTLTREQYHVTKENGTEPPFRNAYWNNHDAGLYVDVISGEALFASIHKFDSGTGWPSFWQPINKEAIASKDDASHGMDRTEVRSAKSDAHLGHVFTDGPKPAGLRYCINSASLRFIPVAKLQEAGYEAFLPLFESGDKK